MKEAVLYIIAPCYNEEEVLPCTIPALERELASLIQDPALLLSAGSRIVFVDDGSSDSTWKLIKSAAATSSSIIGLKFSGNRGHQNAIMAGMMYALDAGCDLAITIDADLQQEPAAMKRFILEHQKGYDIVFGVRTSRGTDSFFKRATAQGYYRLMTRIGCRIIPNHADYRLIDRKALEALSRYPEYNLFLRGIIPQLGFRTAQVEFEVRERSAGTSKYTLRKMLRLASDGITSFSTWPVHVIMGTGGAVSLLSLILILGMLIAFGMGKSVPEWMLISFPVWLLFGIVIFSIGVVGEYVGKVSMEVKRRPRYLIDEVAGESAAAALRQPASAIPASAFPDPAASASAALNTAASVAAASNPAVSVLNDSQEDPQ